MTTSRVSRGAHMAPAGQETSISFSRITQAASRFWDRCRPVHAHPLAEGLLANRDTFYQALLSYQPRSFRLRLLVRLAEVDVLTERLAAALFRLQAGSSFARFAWADEADRNLWLEAATCCPPDTAEVAPVVGQVFSDLQHVLADDRLDAALALAKARSCAQAARSR